MRVNLCQSLKLLLFAFKLKYQKKGEVCMFNENPVNNKAISSKFFVSFSVFTNTCGSADDVFMYGGNLFFREFAFIHKKLCELYKKNNINNKKNWNVNRKYELIEKINCIFTSFLIKPYGYVIINTLIYCICSLKRFPTSAERN